jgi:DNA-binding MarR family transcriptional regulator
MTSEIFNNEGHAGQPPSALQSAAELRQGVLRLARRLRVSRSSGALSNSKIRVLSHLHRHGPATPGELASLERQQPQALTRVFAELERDGLVSRTRDGRDRRRSLLDITAAGGDILARDMAERDAWLASTLAEMGESDRRVLRLAGSLMERIADSPKGDRGGLPG